MPSNIERWNANPNKKRSRPGPRKQTVGFAEIHDEINDPLDTDMYRAERDRMEKIISRIVDKKGKCRLSDLRKVKLSERFNILDMGFATVRQDIWSHRIQWVRTEESKEVMTNQITITPPNPRIEANLGL